MQNLIKEESAIELEVKLEHLDIWRFYIDQYLNFGTLFYFLFCLGLFGFTILLFLSENSFDSKQIIGLFVLSLLFSFIFVFFLIYQLAEKAVETENKIKYIISEKYVEIITEELNSRINWSYFKIVKETKNYFFMNTKDSHKIMIPKKDFADSETLSVFKIMLRTRLGNEAYLNTSKKTLNLK